MDLLLEQPSKEVLEKNFPIDTCEGKENFLTFRTRLITIISDLVRISGNHGMWSVVHCYNETLRPLHTVYLTLRTDADPELAGVRLQLSFQLVDRDNVYITVESYEKHERHCKYDGQIETKNTRLSQVAFDKWGADTSYHSNRRYWAGRNAHMFHRAIPALVKYLEKFDRFTAKNAEVDRTKKLLQRDVRKLTDDVDFIAYEASAVMRELFGDRYRIVSKKNEGDAPYWTLELCNEPTRVGLFDQHGDEPCLPKMYSLKYADLPTDYVNSFSSRSMCFSLGYNKESSTWTVKWAYWSVLAKYLNVQNRGSMNFAVVADTSEKVVEYIRRTLAAEKLAHEVFTRSAVELAKAINLDGGLMSNAARFEPELARAKGEI